MVQNGDGRDLMGYEALAQEAMRGLVKSALKRAAGPGGLPGTHHFYISFKTRAAGVSIPADLVEKFSDEMTIVLQNQFWDLAPGETFFSVTLRFGGQPKGLSIPYGAVTRFYDPSVQYLLQFDGEEANHPSAATTGELVSLNAHRESVDTPAMPNPSGSGPDSDAAIPKTAGPDMATSERIDDKGQETAPKDGPKIVSLDQFRKK